MLSDKELIISRLSEAADPTTPPERLRELYTSRSPAAVQQALAGNANTPLEVLLALAAEYPYEFLHNPVLPLLGLEDPNFVRKIPRETALHLLRMEDVPVWLLEQFLSGEKLVARAARLHIGLAGEAGEEWPLEVETAIKRTVDAMSVRRAGQASREEVSVRPGRGSSGGPVKELTLHMIRTLPSWLMDPLIIGLVEGGHAFWSRVLANSTEATRTSAQRMRRAGSSNDLMDYAPPDLTMPAAELELLAQGGIWARIVAARHPNTPHDVLLTLTQDGFPGEENPNASASILEIAANDEDSRYDVARHPHTESETLRRLATDKQNRLRVAVARHPHTPADVLTRLASDDNSFVRGGVARNPAAPPELLTKLAVDAHAAVRFDVARHPGTPPEALSLLSADNDGEILDALLRRRDLPDDLRFTVATHRANVGQRLTWLSKKQILRRVMTGSLLRAELADKKHGVARLRAARSSKTPVDVLRTLAKDSESAARAAVAENQNVPADVLGKLARDKDPEVREYVAANPRTPLAELRRLSDDSALKDDIPETVARNPALSPEIIEHLAAKNMTVIDDNLVRNPATPLAVLQTLASRIRSLEDLAPVVRHRHADTSLKSQVQERLTHGVLFAAVASTTALSRAAALTSPGTKPDELAAAAQSTAWLSRLAVARHPSTALAVLQALERDGNRLVRAAARAALQERRQRENENL